MAPHSSKSDDLDSLEKGKPSMESRESLRNVLTDTVTISPDLFERMYLAPKTDVKGDLRKTVSNPAPLALMGLATGLMPLSIELMGWRGSGGLAVATGTCSMFFGGMLMIIAGIMEFVLGNTFPFIVFMGYGAHFFTFATTFMPSFNAISYYAPTDSATATNQMTTKFDASYGFYPISMAILNFIFLVGSFRTNAVLVAIFVLATIGFSFDAAGLFYSAADQAAIGNGFTVVVGACFFGASLLVWYLFLAEVILMMELPVPDLPAFDLSTVIRARSRAELVKEKDVA